MRTRESRAKLIDLIRNSLYDAFGTDFFKAVRKELVAEGKFTNEEFYKYRLKPEQLQRLSDAELYLFMEAIAKVEPAIGSIEDYFTEYEVRDYKNFVRNSVNMKDLYVLKNAFQLEENQWSCVASVEQIALMSKYGIIRIDPNYQRQSKTIGLLKDTNEILRKIYVRQSRVNEIEDAIVHRKYFFNTLRINLMDDGEHAPQVYKEGLLLIPQGSDCIIPDGNHRRKACEQAYFNYPDLRSQFANQYFQIAFTVYPPHKVRELITQEWNVEPVNRKHVAAMKVNMTNEVVDEIKRNEKAERLYADYIVTTGNECRSGNGFIIYSVLAEAIKRYYKTDQMQLKSQAKALAEWLIEFFNDLAALLVDDFAQFQTVKHRKWSVNPYTFVGYVYLSSKLREETDWQQQLRTLLEGIDWSIESSPMKTGKEYNHMRVVEAYFEERLKTLKG